ncbi:hypothetical protein RM66_21510 [Xanthomonas phaseoli pv. phaseoli]|uniref:Transposase n=1 Tax=Xanthomonas campestris pv. phaseoli TaxID=317013 RepID=A0AB34QCW3_XANCH|nr:hypothetical protein PK68_21420 [Xanthomonas phaseoli pv. phaseoli]KHD60020.1 hypothetical protein PK63_21285 [Xanthomonas phaseoli pv. phaseoli]KHS20921.1 hypothetical protein RM66_21510 [Xanthomonas phaseoli pv. phaseoli]KHS33466.1 hypothetical protein RN20_21715 [Xanthomonas phaseoli pv. phaseoli]
MLTHSILLADRCLLYLRLLRLHPARQRRGHRIGLCALQRWIAGFPTLGWRHLNPLGVAALHRLRFERVLCFLCLTRLRVTWARRRLWWVRWVGSHVFACVLILDF